MTAAVLGRIPDTPLHRTPFKTTKNGSINIDTAD